MGRHRIGANSEHVATALAELRHPTAHGGQLGGSDQGKITRVKKQDEPAVQIIIQAYLPWSLAGAIDARKRKGWSPCPNHGTAHRHCCLLELCGRGCSVLAIIVLGSSLRSFIPALTTGMPMNDSAILMAAGPPPAVVVAIKHLLCPSPERE
jgi:hypothetical protein